MSKSRRGSQDAGLLVHLQQQGAPRRRDGEVHEGALALAFQVAAVERKVLLVLEGDVCCLQRLVDAQLLCLGERLGLIAVEGAHVVQQAMRRAETVAKLWASFHGA